MLSTTGNLERAGSSEKIQPQINAMAESDRCDRYFGTAVRGPVDFLRKVIVFQRFIKKTVIHKNPFISDG